MGFFDSLAKLGKELSNNEAVKEFTEELKKGASSLNENINTNVAKEIPSRYSEFPVFNGIISSLNDKSTPNYVRCTIDYRNTTSTDITNYVNEVISNGYVKNSNVRYDKNNSYIIIEENGNNLHLVYHIKN